MPQIDLTKVIPIKLLSHSSIETLHSCPRKFEIYRNNFLPKEQGTVDTAFGHAVGVGIQELLILQKARDEVDFGMADDDTERLYSMLSDYQLAVWKMFLSWEAPIDEVKPKAKKGFHTACLAVETYMHQLLPALASTDWELAYFNDKPAVELGFIVSLPNGYYYRGYVDAVLVNHIEKRFRVLEIKTTGLSVVDIAQYKNSFQGVGYGVILDKLAASLGT
ncbi:MAG: PD-(D/E)XK nuclease family protein, partial [Anaerovoracaceae bacterium]